MPWNLLKLKSIEDSGTRRSNLHAYCRKAFIAHNIIEAYKGSCLHYLHICFEVVSVLEVFKVSHNSVDSICKYEKWTCLFISTLQIWISFFCMHRIRINKKIVSKGVYSICGGMHYLLVIAFFASFLIKVGQKKIKCLHFIEILLI